MKNYEIIFKAMQENMLYTINDICRITGILENQVMRSLIKLQVGGLISSIGGGIPKRRLYKTNQTSLPLPVPGHEKSQPILKSLKLVK